MSIRYSLLLTLNTTVYGNGYTVEPVNVIMSYNRNTGIIWSHDSLLYTHMLHYYPLLYFLYICM